MHCTDNYIGLSICDGETPPVSGFSITDGWSGFSVKQIASTAHSDFHTARKSVDRATKMAYEKLWTATQSAMLSKYYRLPFRLSARQYGNLNNSVRYASALNPSRIGLVFHKYHNYAGDTHFFVRTVQVKSHVANAQATLQILGESLQVLHQQTVIVNADTLQTITLNIPIYNQRIIYIAFGALQIQPYANDTDFVGACECEGHAMCYFARWQEGSNAVPAYSGVTACVEVRCDQERLFCEHKDLFKFPILYATAVELINQIEGAVISGNRLNWVTITADMEHLGKVREYLEGEVNKHMPAAIDRFLGIVQQGKSDCFACGGELKQFNIVNTKKVVNNSGLTSYPVGCAGCR